MFLVWVNGEDHGQADGEGGATCCDQGGVALNCVSESELTLPSSETLTHLLPSRTHLWSRHDSSGPHAQGQERPHHELYVSDIIREGQGIA